jgi:hypothetical protein
MLCMMGLSAITYCGLGRFRKGSNAIPMGFMLYHLVAYKIYQFTQQCNN